MRRSLASRFIILAWMVWMASPLLAAPPGTTQVPAVIDALRTRFGVTDLSTSEGKVADITGLVALQRTLCPEAVLTSGFYDWRTVSRYRRNPGLHLGYDIAMPAGTPVRAGWPGTVVSVAPWTEGEWGLTVRSASGTEVTYGHIRPSLSAGDPVQVGTIVGTISIDHVDVKMRDSAGNYVDFGGQASASATTPFAAFAADSREAQMVTWLVARNSLETSESELEGRRREKASAALERRRLESRRVELEQAVPLMARYVEEGLVSRAEAEKTRSDLATTLQALARLKKRQKEAPERIAELENQVRAARSRLAVVERRARQRGITWAEVTGFVNGVVARDARLRDQVLDYKRDKQETRTRRVGELRQEVRAGRQNLAELENLYEMGGLPRREIEAARERQQILEAELKSLEGS
ncbi:MAG: peptidoglycan DD-metalloendopeptidase family protein [Candidatus Xenobium sp.]|nr:peptidoglycan DD-metalloendopeptidase family protein [Burkholderiales bacterium]